VLRSTSLIWSKSAGPTFKEHAMSWLVPLEANCSTAVHEKPLTRKKLNNCGEPETALTEGAWCPKTAATSLTPTPSSGPGHAASPQTASPDPTPHPTEHKPSANMSHHGRPYPLPRCPGSGPFAASASAARVSAVSHPPVWTVMKNPWEGCQAFMPSGLAAPAEGVARKLSGFLQ